jgi:hypothetical protein
VIYEMALAGAAPALLVFKKKGDRWLMVLDQNTPAK